MSNVELLQRELHLFPEFEICPWFKGIARGGCVDGGHRFRRRAHAHLDGPYRGWICVLSAKRPLRTASGKPSMLMIHEFAHFYPKEVRWHNDRFRANVRALGGTINWYETKAYHKGRRKR